MAKKKAPNKEVKADDNKGGLEINELEKETGALVTPGKRLYLTADRKSLVPEGHAEARILYCTESSKVPRDEFNKLKQKK